MNSFSRLRITFIIIAVIIIILFDFINMFFFPPSKANDELSIAYIL